MANLEGIGIDENVEESSNFNLKPAGIYPVIIIKDEIKTTSTGGKLIEITMLITEGQYKNETITDRLNLVNASPVAQKIGQGTLKKICRLTNLPWPPKDTSEWKGILMLIKITVEEFKSKRTGEMLSGNKIKNYMPYVKLENKLPETPVSTGIKNPW